VAAANADLLALKQRESAMLDAKGLLDQFLGSNAGAAVQQAGGKAKAALDQVAAKTPGGMTGLAGMAAAGGVLALLLGGKKIGKLAGGAVRYGGAAALGALAYRAFQNWQTGQPASAPPPALPGPSEVPAAYLPGAAPAAGGEPFELSLMRAMIGAAKADGHVDQAEQQRIFDAVERMGMDAEAKAFVFDTLNRPADPAAIAAAATTREQAAQIYLASRMAIDPDHPAERAYLDALVQRLSLPAELVAQLDRQLTA
jgi:uncharacterized membrane protein YebE (DUF533 family)